MRLNYRFNKERLMLAIASVDKPTKVQGKEMGVCHQMLYRLRRGEDQCPRLDTLCRIADYYGVPLDEFVEVVR